MKKKITIFFLFFYVFSFSQNWDVFNKNYRYNYKYNHSSLISNVLFADTVKAVGIDTVYSLNRIGLVCNGSCPSLSINPTTTVLVTNIPQFLQRNIRKYNNGLVKLYDTTKIVINPYCVLNQSWLFDSIYNLTAQCVLINTENIFSIVDSVKTILINNLDTLKLSKQFGIIQFPELYAKNKYYRLVGIEKRKYYDSIPFLGLRVPNAWDFYNYNVGDQMWTTSSYYYGSGPMAPTSCQIFKKTIKSKTILPNGFVYNVDEYGVSYSVPGIFSCSQYMPNPPSLNNFNISFIGLTKDSLIENRMFPNMVFPLFGNTIPKNITKFGLDNNGIFYKYFGPSCNSSGITIMPNQSAPNGFDSYISNPGYYSILSSGEKYALCYGVGFGEINSNYGYFETFSDFCLNKFIKNNITYFGGSNILGLEESSKEQSGLVYPNPVNSVLNVRLEGAFQIKIYNSVGQLVLNKQLDDPKELDVSNFNSGIYLIKMKNDSYSLEKKIIIRH